MSLTQKITLYFFLLIFPFAGVISQTVIGPDLQQKLEIRQEDALIPVNILLVQQYDSELLYEKSLNYFSPNARRNAVIKELQIKSRKVNGNFTRFSTQGIENGIYLVRVHTAKGISKHILFIVNI